MATETDVTKSPWYGNCAEDLDFTHRVKLQATAQKHVDHAISSTVNLPADASVEDVKKVYEAAWKAGCKGITVYRKGCRDGVILEKGLDNSPTCDKIDIERPRVLQCNVHHTSVKGQSYFVLVGLLDGKPYEVFAGKNGFISSKVKTGTITRKRKNFYIAKFDGTEDELSPITAATNELEEVVTRLTSLSLRSGADMHRVVQQLEKVGERQELNSFARGVARVLKKYIPDGTEEEEKCPECQAESMIRQEGCVLCKSCGWSRCL
jgi:ribonucleoside-diphosphate reductase alpha chain